MRSFFRASYFTFVGIFAINSISAQIAAVEFTVIVPEFSSQHNAVHLVGSFNGWSTGDSFYIMKKVDGNIYSLTVPLFEGKNYQYKYTLGGWNTVEIKMNDSDIVNRKLFSRNSMNVNDTVFKWKTPVAVQQQSVSLQMQKIMAMKDSLGSQLQPTFNKLLVLLKQYNEAMLSQKPNESVRKKIKKQTIGVIADIYKTIEAKIWDIGTSLTPDQRQKILTAIKTSNSKPEDIPNNIFNAYSNELK